MLFFRRRTVDAVGLDCALKSILDPKFRYVPAAETDIKKTFARVRREQAKAHAAQLALRANVTDRALIVGGDNVQPMRKPAGKP